MKLKRHTKFGKESTFRFKIDKFWPEHSKVSKSFILMGSFWGMCIFFQLKKYRGVVFHETEEGYKIWRGMDLLFQN